MCDNLIRGGELDSIGCFMLKRIALYLRSRLDKSSLFIMHKEFT